ncbi:MAG: right-handed parallel beta-helix repeat-containing protein, partial [Candidatus Bathyarchaeota archaeon]
IFGNIIRNNWYGIRLNNSTNNDISENYIANNDEGIQLYESSNNNSISENTLVNDGLTVYGSYENIVDNNWVNGKSLIYLEDVSDCVIEDAGQVILVNCSHITIRNSRLSNTTTGVHLSHTKSTEISGNNITANSDIGIQLHESSNNNIFGNYIANNDEGIQLYESSNNNSISENNITTNIWDGIQLHESSNNNIFGNYITANNQSSIRLYSSSNNNSIFGNYIANNYEAIQLFWSSVGNIIYHNNFINNLRNIPAGYSNWDAGYPSGGNYWSNYEGIDLNSGKGQNETGRDGIGDTQYGQDNYPLMGMFSDFNATSENHVQTICNSSISYFQYNGTALIFNVTGEDNTTGFCRICIPTTLINETYKVFVDGTKVSLTLLPCSNTTHSYLYFTYNHSKQEVIVIPEFPDWSSMLLLLIGLAVAIMVHKLNLLKTPTSVRSVLKALVHAQILNK